MVPEVALRAALETKLAATITAVSPTTKIAYENVKFIPAAGSTYVKCFVLPSDTIAPSIGAQHTRWIGIFQVVVVFPVDTGMLSATNLSSAISSAFKRGLILEKEGFSIFIERAASIYKPIQVGAEVNVPISIWYRMDQITN